MKISNIDNTYPYQPFLLLTLYLVYLSSYQILLPLFAHLDEYYDLTPLNHEAGEPVSPITANRLLDLVKDLLQDSPDLQEDAEENQV